MKPPMEAGLVTPRPIVIEFVGLPGAGKTSAAKEIIEQMRLQGYACADRKSIQRGNSGRAMHYARLAVFNLRHCQTVSTILCLGLAVRPFALSRARFAMELPVWSYRLKLAQDRGDDLLILDQGILQDAWSVMIRGELRSETALSRALGSLLLGTKLRFAFVYFDVDIDVAVERTSNRPATTCRFDRMNSQSAKRLLTAHRKHLETIFDQALQVTHAPSCRVDSSRTLGEVCKDVADFIGSVAPSPDWAPSRLLSAGET